MLVEFLKPENSRVFLSAKGSNYEKGDEIVNIFFILVLISLLFNRIVYWKKAWNQTDIYICLIPCLFPVKNRRKKYLSVYCTFNAERSCKMHRSAERSI